ncbi:polysaccharide biosynthesis/export family protein [Rubrimonas sp.]|uniref:polysaccharide biosynthesis/export family protein n=1 Tax=Rubrimonas sp. TaxID=2036015 RepID=UPI002FDE7E39
MTVADTEGLEALVAPLTAEVATRAARPQPPRFTPAMRAAPPIDPVHLGRGDVIDVAIWESQDSALFNGGGGPAMLEGVTLDEGGRVYVPFVGPVQAAGATPAVLRARITAALEPLTLSPQVDVRLREARSRLVTVQGVTPRPGVYPIEPVATRLTPMLALAGGSTLPPEQTEVLLRRGGEIGSAMLEDLYADPTLDIALAPDDIIVLKAIRERFVVLGATGLQTELTFPTRNLSLLRALGAARGLQDFNADATGVFVLRREDTALADAILPGAAPEGLPPGPGRPVIYRLFMNQPEALFVAQAFQMRDGDAIYVTNAPLTELRKIVSLFTAVLAPVQQSAVIAP